MCIRDRGTIEVMRALWPDANGICPMGPLRKGERSAIDVLGEAADHQPGCIALAAHLEARPEPRGIFAEANREVRRLVACYQPPERFIPGLDAATPADLASAAAQAGWTIERFETLVGQTRLMLSR